MEFSSPGYVVPVLAAIFTAGGLVTGLKIFIGETKKHSSKLDNLTEGFHSFREDLAVRLGQIDNRMTAFEGSLKQHDEKGNLLREHVQDLALQVRQIIR